LDGEDGQQAPPNAGDSRMENNMNKRKARVLLVKLRAGPEGAPLSREQAAERLGCRLSTVQAIEADPTFWRAVHDSVLNLERANLPLVYAGLRAKAANGDASASKLYLTQLGVLSDDTLPEPDAGGDASEWRALRAAVLNAVGDHPLARESILNALGEALAP
jgi:hypothetical protein